MWERVSEIEVAMTSQRTRRTLNAICFSPPSLRFLAQPLGAPRVLAHLFASSLGAWLSISALQPELAYSLDFIQGLGGTTEGLMQGNE